EIEKRLVELPGISVDGVHVLSEGGANADGLVDCALEQTHDLGDDAVRVDGSEGHARVFPGKGQELLGELGSAAGRGFDCLYVFCQGAAARELLPQERGIAEDAGENVVEIMGNAACQRSNRLHL